MNTFCETTQPTIAPYATWTSPITAEKTALGTSSILNMLIDGSTTYWSEARPSNKGRYTLVRRQADGSIDDMTAPDFNVRSCVHEYGGGAFAVRDGIIYASNGTDHKLYVIKPNEPPRPLTAGQQRIATAHGKTTAEGTRFGDLLCLRHGLVAVGEHHSPGQPVENFLAWIDSASGAHAKLASGYDFYASPAVSADERKLAWICWNHPHMPWTNTELWVADISDHGTLKNAQRIAGELPEAICQPQWAANGDLYFVTDRDRGWWNIHRYVDGAIENICPMEGEVAEPLWVFGRSTYAFLGDHLLFSYNQAGTWHLAAVHRQTKEVQQLARQAAYIHQLRSGDGYVQFLEASSTEEERLMQIENLPNFPATSLHSKEMSVAKGYISQAQHIAFPSGQRTAYGFYYPPANSDYQAPEGEKPPLIVMIHGGPTAQAKGTFQLSRQYWTSQGFALLDVNYGGSTGYGRAYRLSLDHQWGVVDVEDCVNGARFLVEQGLADEEKLVIRGGSAGGFTTLAALAFKDTFKAGASYYGVADITALAEDTHKFEAHYMDTLVGKYPEEKLLWETRSPIHAADQIRCPLIIFQGEDDPIVPKNQSVMIYEALKRQGIKVELHIYPGEEHGFRQAPHIIHSLKHEADFYRSVFNSPTSDRQPGTTLSAIPSPYLEFSRASWRQFRRDTPMSLTPADIEKLQGQVEKISVDEVEEIYLPLTRLLNMYVEASKSLYDVTEQFLGHAKPKVPYIIGVAGSVAVGKSTTSRILQALLSHTTPERRVEIVTTDGFLYPNAVLEQKGIMQRKGFPESYDLRRLITFLSDLKAGKPNLRIPVYNHHIYDIVPGSYQTVDQPDIVIVEGLNVLQVPSAQRAVNNQLFVSDFFDFSIYVDADSALIKKWFLDRFTLFRERAKSDPTTFFHQFALWPDDKALAFADEVWTSINERNLYDNILPYRQRAQLILTKGDNHAISKILLRKL